MIEIQNYAPFIQLAVAFDFACVTLNTAKERAYKQVEDLFKTIQDKANRYVKRINDIIAKNHEDVTAPALKPKSDKLKVSLNKCTSGLNKIKDRKLIYLGPAALISGIYSIFALLLLGEIHKYQFLQVIYSLLTEYTIIVLIYYFGKEICAYVSEKYLLSKSAYIYALGIILFVGVLALLGGLFDIHFGTFKIRFFNFYHISLFSLIIPYIPFVVAILWIVICIINFYFYFLLSKFLYWKYKRTEKSYYNSLDQEVKEAEAKYNSMKVVFEPPIPPEHLKTDVLPSSAIFMDKLFEIQFLPETESIQEDTIGEESPLVLNTTKTKIKSSSLKYRAKRDLSYLHSNSESSQRPARGDRKARNNPLNGGRGK